jgi:hypothetical protein
VVFDGQASELDEERLVLVYGSQAELQDAL